MCLSMPHLVEVNLVRTPAPVAPVSPTPLSTRIGYTAADMVTRLVGFGLNPQYSSVTCRLISPFIICEKRKNNRALQTRENYEQLPDVILCMCFIVEYRILLYFPRLFGFLLNN